MTKLYGPWPSAELSPCDKGRIANACWWRTAMTVCNEDGYIYFLERNENTGVVTIEWFDGFDIKLDMGLDKPNIDGISFTYIRPIEYIDLLAAHAPTPESYRITEYGDRIHPGMEIMPDLDWKVK